MKYINEYACAELPVIARATKEIISAWILFEPGPSKLSIYYGENHSGNINNVMKGTINFLVQLSGGVFKKYYLESRYVNRESDNTISLNLIDILVDKGYITDESLMMKEDRSPKEFQTGFCEEYKHFYSFHQGGIEIINKYGSYCIADVYGDHKSVCVYLNGANTEYVDYDKRTDIKLLGFRVSSCVDTAIDKILDVLNTSDEKVSIDKDILASIIKDQVPRGDLELVFEQTYVLQQESKHVLISISFIGANSEEHERLLEYTTKNLYVVKLKLDMMDTGEAQYIEVREL